MNVPLLTRQQDWFCPNCPAVDRTVEARPHTRFHACRGLKGLTAPMLPAGMDAKVDAKPWDDMLYGELAQRDGDGRPVSAVVTTRADGSNDVAVFPATARLNLRED